MFYIKKHHLLSSGAKAKDKIPVETHYTISDYVYSEIFSSKVPNLIIHTVIRKKNNGKTIDCFWDYSFILLNSIGL